NKKDSVNQDNGKKVSSKTPKADDKLDQENSEVHNALIGQLLGSVTKILTEEGFALNNDKTKIIRSGNQQAVTGMVVNGEDAPRVPRKVKRMLRAAIHNLQNGQGLRAGESYQTLIGYAAWIAMAEPELGHYYLNQIDELRNQQHEATL
ncbi:MAG: hypothetical protein Q4P13_00315, partial [Psychrobacter sp.]|nr:hypothetical protein [Psychrobacter sp.]